MGQLMGAERTMTGSGQSVEQTYGKLGATAGASRVGAAVLNTPPLNTPLQPTAGQGQTTGPDLRGGSPGNLVEGHGTGVSYSAVRSGLGGTAGASRISAAPLNVPPSNTPLQPTSSQGQTTGPDLRGGSPGNLAEGHGTGVAYGAIKSSLGSTANASRGGSAPMNVPPMNTPLQPTAGQGQTTGPDLRGGSPGTLSEGHGTGVGYGTVKSGLGGTTGASRNGAAPLNTPPTNTPLQPTAGQGQTTGPDLRGGGPGNLSENHGTGVPYGAVKQGIGGMSKGGRT